jgi:hypothetical protein
MVSLTPFYKIGTSYSARRIWYVCHVEKNVSKIFDMHTLTLMFHSTQKRKSCCFALLSCPSHCCRHCPSPLQHCLHPAVHCIAVTRSHPSPPQLLPLGLHQSLPPQPYSLEVSNRVQEGMVLTSSWHGVLLLTMMWHCPPPPSTGPQKQ